jgi:hypothetical protein
MEEAGQKNTASTGETVNDTVELTPNLKTARQELADQAQPTSSLKEGEVHIADRTWEDAGKRSTNAFQFNHPELHSYYVEAAQALQADLNDTVKGEWYAVKDQEGYITGMTGNKRMTSEAVEHALDDAHLTYDQIGKAIDALIQDHGQENYAAAKKVELVLDEMLSEGYTDITGEWIEPNEDYIQARDRIGKAVDSETRSAYDEGTQELQGGAVNGGEGRYDGQGVLGENVRSGDQGQTGNTYTGVSSQIGKESERVSAETSGRISTKTSSGTAEWARGNEVTTPNAIAERAAELSRQYQGDVQIVKDSAIKGQNARAWALDPQRGGHRG